VRLQATDAAVPGGYGELLVSSLLVLGVVCVVAWLVVRYGGRWLAAGQAGRGVEVLARVPLEPRRSLFVIEAAGKTLLLGTSEMGLTVLAELDGAVFRAEAGQRAKGGGLAALVQAALERRRGKGGGPGEGRGDGWSDA
jgi:flagellar biosynthetic protein FliO